MLARLGDSLQATLTMQEQSTNVTTLLSLWREMTSADDPSPGCAFDFADKVLSEKNFHFFFQWLMATLKLVFT
jgi:hypothetical protein